MEILKILKRKKDRRKLSNSILGKHRHLKLTICVSLIPTLGMFVVSWVLFEYFESAMKLLPEFQQSQELAASLEIHKSEYFSLLCASYGALGLIAFWISVTINNRLIGPLVPLEAHLKKLIDGKTSNQLKLRKEDLLDGTALLINELTAKIDHRKNKD